MSEQVPHGKQSLRLHIQQFGLGLNPAIDPTIITGAAFALRAEHPQESLGGIFDEVIEPVVHPCSGRKLMNLAHPSIVAAFLLGAIVGASAVYVVIPKGPSNFDECVLTHGSNASNMVMLMEVQRRCRNLFPE